MPGKPAPEIAPREDEIEFTAIRAQGAGGQNVNKVANAIQLRYDVRACSLPAGVRERLLAHPDRRISADGVVVIKAQRFRSLEQNRADALARLRALIAGAAHTPPPRRPTRPPRGVQLARIEGKLRRGRVKALRARVQD